MAGKDGRSCIWAFLLYPESMPDNAMSWLAKCGLPVYVSPLHDSDLLTLEDVIDDSEQGCVAGYDESMLGQLKKPHYHVMIRFSSNKSSAQVLKILEPLGIKYVLRLGTSSTASGSSWRGYARYLCHLDNPEKHQYSRDDVQAFNAPDYRLAAAVNMAAERAWTLDPVYDFIRDNEITSYAVLIDYCRSHRPDLYEVIVSSPGRVISYMKSCTWESRSPIRSFILAGRATTTPAQQIESKSLDCQEDTM